MKRPMMPMATLAKPSADVTVLEALEFVAPCGIRVTRYAARFPIAKEDPCDRPGVWVAMCRGCETTRMMCDEHRAFVEQMPVVYCVRCDDNRTPAERFLIVSVGS